MRVFVLITLHCSLFYPQPWVYLLHLSTSTFIYLVLTFWRLAYRHYKKKNEKVYSFQIHLVDKILELYSECHRKGGQDGKINSFLFQIMFTKSRDENENICREIYAFEEEVHNNDKCEIYCCLHKNLDPLIMEYILEIQFPGVIQKGLSYLKSIKCLSACVNFIDKVEWINSIASTMRRMVKIELEYLDILKDTFLAFSLYRILGGYEAMQAFSTHFSIIVVLCFFGSEVIPIVFATLHLAINNPWMVGKSRLEKTGLITLFSVLSFLNPIILVNAYEDAKEKTRKLAQSLDASFSQQMKKFKCIKTQWSTFIKIELGKNINR